MRLAFFKQVPPFVWAILAYLLFVGVGARKNRIVSLKRLFIMPVILLGMKGHKLFNSEAFDVALYSISLLFTLSIGMAFGKRSFDGVTKGSGIELKGENVTLVVLLSFFALKFALGYLYTTGVNVVSVDMLISGALTGFFLGKTFYYVQASRKAQATLD